MTSTLKIFLAAFILLQGNLAVSATVLESQLTELESEQSINEHLLKTLVVLPEGAIEFSEEIEVKCIVAPCDPVLVQRRFRIASAKPLECGSRLIIAYEFDEQQAFPDQFVPAQLEITDHTDRYCRDYRPHLWEIRLINELGEVRRFGGSPGPVLAD